ncbi:MAG: molybdopterin molybdenumtransferase MoeA, partial [Lentisphaerae bacterium]
MTDPTISFQQAQEIMLKIAADCAPAWGSERIEFTRSLGRVLAEDIHADRPMPPFPRAAVDGYACRAQDLPGKLRIIEEIRAGSWPTRTIQPGTCSRI